MTELPNTPNWLYWLSLIYPVLSFLLITGIVWNDAIKTKFGKATVTLFTLIISCFATASAFMLLEMKGLITL